MKKVADVSEERIASIIGVKRTGEEGTTLAVTSNRSTHIIFLRSVLRLLVTCHPENGGDSFRRNVGSYKSHTT
jgi:hypothetical protein